MQIVCSSTTDRAAWLEARKTGIGASEAAAVQGVDPWRTPFDVWSVKVGLKEERDLADEERVQWGNRLEPVILDAFAERTGRAVMRGGELLRHDDEQWALCTLDGRCSENGAEPWPLEVKTTSAYRVDDWEEGPPEPYLVQLHQQMLVTGAPKATIACLLGGQRLVWCDVERDEQRIRKIIHHGREMWRRVLEKDPPPVDGSGSTARTLASLYPQHEENLIVTLPPELRETVEELAELREQKNEIESRLRHRENIIKATLGAAEVGIFPGGLSVTWRTRERAAHTVAASKYRTLRVHRPRI